jgi:hypothetical protein
MNTKQLSHPEIPLILTTSTKETKINMLSDTQIEMIVETSTNSLDRQLMNSNISQVEYDAEMRTLACWAEEQYKKLDEVFALANA